MKSNSTYLEGNFKGLQHIGVPVTDLSVSIDFYIKLGFRKIFASIINVPEEDDKIQVAMMEQNGAIVELYQVTEKDMKELRTRQDGHLDHIAFGVADVEKAFHELKQAEFEMVENEPVFLNFWRRGCRYFAVRGPDGEKLEFNQIL